MTSRELFHKFESLETALNRSGNLLNVVRGLAVRQKEVTELLGKIVSTANQADCWAATEVVRNKLKQTVIELKVGSPRRVFKEIENAVHVISETESTWDAPTVGKLELLKKDIESFGEAYETLFRE